MKIRFDGPTWLKKLVGAGLFLACGIAVHGILLSVEYRWAKVMDVQTVAGKSERDRVVLVKAPDRLRVLRTSDPFVATIKGAQVCVSKRRLIARQWVRYNVVLPGYCRKQPKDLTAENALVLN
ncbi:hypothetical protein Z946_2938 [Sulfitobacter noctilucicola]|uniref:Uncharacterized protein n=1 Tax=Sulfitobacter noctilucicola TaxID=1342301 RepID=A0A7W6MAW2_9RHOB|nr:hypothetical protein [Sulfitobacter noctilucicola]KIN64052.1 hypothetical protein Z946_2938 [Sulfitobacter noctilucicola]MBB4175407.1 hypothetical protein [Sulfitobacter noctilucicola]